MAEKSFFRYDINALRAIAVIAVLFFHFKVPFFKGGFSGVDIFYVISGYLMTGIIMRGLANGTLSTMDFYKRRTQRIIPALLFLILIVILFCFFFYFPSNFKSLCKNALSSLLFISNVVYAEKGDYFAASSDTNTLLHTWSLSLEWQFYLILPIVLAALNKFIKNNRFKFLLFFLVATSVSFIFCLILTDKYPTYSFYLLPSRSWEMMAGGIAFLIEGKMPLSLKKISSTIGYAILIGCVVLLDDSLHWPGYFTLLPVFGTFIILIANDSNRVIRWKIFQFFGKISYSLYLWHWPIYVIAFYLGAKSSTTTILLLTMISVLFGVISYRYIESIKIEKVRYVILPAILLVIITSIFWKLNTNRFVFSHRALAIVDFHEDRILQYSVNSCYINSGGLKSYESSKCMFIEKGKKNVILIGDSHGAHLSQALRENLNSINVHMNQATAPYCLPLLKKNGAKGCSDIMDYVYNDYIPRHAKEIDGVIISANWLVADDLFQLGLDLNETINYLKKLNIKVVILGQNETYNISFKTIAAREVQYGSILSDNYISQKSVNTNIYLKTNFKEYYVDIYNLKNVPKLSSANVPYMNDINHYTTYGANNVANVILENKVFLKFLD